MAARLTDRENYLRRIEGLALSVLPITEITAAAPEHHDGVMVALVPDDPGQLAVDNEDALPADDLHVTLCFLGKVQDLSNADMTRILSKTRSVCDAVGSSFTTNVDGVVVMGQNDEGVPATALLIQSDEIVALYDALSEALDYESKYPTFIPHMTTGYGVPVEEVEPNVGSSISFSKVIVKFGDAVHEIPLTTSLVAAPRGANVIDRVIDSLGRLWDEALHPRDAEGKFIKKNGAISGKLAVPTRDRKGVNMVDANRASVIGFHTFDNEVWVLAEITNQDGSKTQGFARATAVQAVAPVKARLDALYPIDDHGDAFINSSLERKRQLDLILAHINTEFGSSNDTEGAQAFLDTLGLWEKDLDYLRGGDDDSYLGGLRKVDRQLDDDELDEQEDIIEDAKTVKTLRDRVHGLKEAANNPWFSHDELDEFLDATFGEDPTEVRKEKHPRSGMMVNVGLERNVFTPEKGKEGPAVFNITDHGEFPDKPMFPDKNVRTEKIEHVYRGMSMEEWEQAQESGFIQSDKRGVIADWEGTNAAADRRSAISYLPRNGSGVVVKIAVEDEDEWFTISADGYLRTRKPIPLDRIEVVSPVLTKENGTLMKPADGIGINPDDKVHVQPRQNLLTKDVVDPDVVAALDGGADPFSLETNNLLGAMHESKRFQQRTPTAETGVSPIDWLVDPAEKTDYDARLSGTGTSTTDRAYFVKQSVIGAELGNTDIVNEVAASLIAENVAQAVGTDDSRLLKIPRSVFGDNPEWDGKNPPGSGDLFNMEAIHQPAHVVSQHAGYLVPSDWNTTDALTEEGSFRNDIRNLDEAAQVDQTAAFYEDIGDIYGNSVTKMVLWDFAILNGDRNPGNAILAAPPDGSEGVVLPIDHGFSFDEPYTDGAAEETFDWFIDYHSTRAWLNYVRGGLDLNNNVTEASLRQMIQDFIDTYGLMDTNQIIEAFRSLPGVTDEQIERVADSVTGVVDRVRWISENTDAVLRKIVERSN